MIPVWFHSGTSLMATLTLKKVPDDLYGRLKKTAAEHRRSINSEAIVCLEKMLPRDRNPEVLLKEIRKFRRTLRSIYVTDQDLDEAKRRGRP